MAIGRIISGQNYERTSAREGVTTSIFFANGISAEDVPKRCSIRPLRGSGYSGQCGLP